MTLLLSLFFLASPARAAWPIESFPGSGVVNPHLAIRTIISPLGKLEYTYLAYRRYVPAGDDVVVAYRSGNTWISETVALAQPNDGPYPVNYFPRIAIDTDGTPHLAYMRADFVSTSPHYARRVGSGGNCGPAASWHCMAVPRPSSSGSVSTFNIFVAPAPDGTVHFAYGWKLQDNSLRMIHVSLSANGTWGPLVQLSGDRPSSLVVDSSSQPHVGWATLEGGGGTSGWYHQTTSGWVRESYGPHQIEDNDLHLSGSQPEACYTIRFNSPDYPPNSKSVGFAERSTSGVWTLTPFDLANSYNSGNYRAWDCSMVVKSSGLPSVAYVGTASPNIRVASRNTNDVWVKTAIADNACGTAAVESPSLAKDRDNKLAAAYTDCTGGIRTIKIAHEP